ncbi:uncharacterized protein LOC118439298 [Folsomia candida]|uniref:uncharacterized protein LOC118439298 n=1 Tax=Folsomia candida TaxID=158441 RepID=UPI001604B6C6|nr:uncharacterized protein LOC118439298 [Folsomia candida]
MSSGKTTRRPLTITRRRKVVQFLQANQEMLDNMNDQDVVTAISDHIQKSDHWIQHSDVERWWNQHGAQLLLEARCSPSPQQQQALVQSGSEVASLSSPHVAEAILPTTLDNSILICSEGSILQIPIQANAHIVFRRNSEGQSFMEISDPTTTDTENPDSNQFALCNEIEVVTPD